jgi:hypothetical protein
MRRLSDTGRFRIARAFTVAAIALAVLALTTLVGLTSVRAVRTANVGPSVKRTSTSGSGGFGSGLGKYLDTAELQRLSTLANRPAVAEMLVALAGDPVQRALLRVSSAEHEAAVGAVATAPVERSSPSPDRSGKNTNGHCTSTGALRCGRGQKEHPSIQVDDRGQPEASSEALKNNAGDVGATI